MAIRHQLAAAGLALLLVTSGCASTASDKPATGTTTGETGEPTATASEVVKGTPSPTPTPSPPDNPWGKETIVVDIFASSESSANRTEAVQNAVSYWNDNSQHAKYKANFTVEPVSSGPDIRVKFVEGIHKCSFRTNDDAVGCSPVLSADDRVYRTISIQIETGWDQEITERILKHEFGHILGLGHDDEPQSVMKSHMITSSNRSSE